jgi:tetratricopeptide (TPR) repeat protein
VRELREKLCDVLIEAERSVDAVEELLDFANYLWAMGDIAGAARVLDEVLLLDPEQGEALAMLGALGYAVPGLGDDASGSGEAAPLSTYDIESVGAGRVLGWSVTEPATQAPLEEPFDEPIFASEDDVDVAIANEDTAPTQPAPARDGSDHGIDAELLAEVDFFLNAGLLDDARALLDEQAQLTPETPELFARFEELARRDAAARPREEALAIEGDPSFAVAASLAERAGASGGLSADGRQVSVDGVLAQFKAGIAAEIHASDSATHYDLGLTYREMGLAREALDAFLLAAQDPMRACECHFLIGIMRVDAGEFDLAIGSFLRGLEVVERTVEQELALRYELAHTSAQMGDAERAVAHFERVRALRPGYGDPRGSVEARLAELGASSSSDAEIDAALDELSRRGSIR